MSATATVRVMSAEEIVSSAAGETPFLHWPERGTLFAERQMRLRQLAAGGHAMADFLRFMADVAQAQHAALQRMGPVPLPSDEALQRAARDGVPPLPAVDWPRDAAWRTELRRMVDEWRRSAPAGVRAALDAIDRCTDDELESQADCLLTGVMQGLNLATAPLIAAALQVYWTHLVLSVQAANGASAGDHARGALNPPFGRCDDASLCPCCGSRPTASLTRNIGGSTGQRYLHCSLCSTQWYLQRIRCPHCLHTGRIAYQTLESAQAVSDDDDANARVAQAAIQAETCDDCGHYLKIMHGDRDPFADPVADDLATLTLDLLVAETGKQRHGVNLMLLFGDPEPPPDPQGA
ncbi:MAG: formate dehydrogenase accessory protein FdhE [Proteobacteria bacterium]|nr:formate dehydrogenase accessory protein FdhE [Pseudomonadota bacterium]